MLLIIFLQSFFGVNVLYGCCVICPPVVDRPFIVCSAYLSILYFSSINASDPKIPQII